MPVRLTDDEVRISEAYVSVLDFVSRCALAVNEGNFNYLRDKAGQLESSARRLHEILSDSNCGARVRTGAVRRAVAEDGRYYDACRLLHPLRREGGR